MASLLCIFLIDNCYESAQLTVDGVTFGMVPCAIGKQDEQAMKGKPVSNIPPWTLHQLPPLGSYPSFLSVMAYDLRVVNWDKPFPPQFDLVTFFYFFFFFFITVTETLSKTSVSIVQQQPVSPLTVSLLLQDWFFLGSFSAGLRMALISLSIVPLPRGRESHEGTDSFCLFLICNWKRFSKQSIRWMKWEHESPIRETGSATLRIKFKGDSRRWYLLEASILTTTTLECEKIWFQVNRQSPDKTHYTRAMLLEDISKYLFDWINKYQRWYL